MNMEDKQPKAQAQQPLPAPLGSMSAELRQSLSEQWSYHVGRCTECRGYPTLCWRGKSLHRRLHPDDWDGDKPTR
jgi:hypothetical protein